MIQKGKSAPLMLPGIAFNLNQHGALAFTRQELLAN